jgi:3-phenylpropionate/trans-cinnamate dioxygenase ferredoxin reductase subunit
MNKDTMVVVGGGQAGGWVIKTLRSEGFTGPIVLISAETHPPYERPPLSKNLLRNADAISETALLSEADLESAGVEAWLGDEVVEIDRAGRTVRCASGREQEYHRLFLTTGSRPRIPDWMAASRSGRAHVLRTIDDASSLRAGLASTGHLVIVGGGWIGLEVAASVRDMGIAVTVVESASRLCQRSVPEPVSHWLRTLHEGHGVTFLMGRSVEGLVDEADHIGITLDDGSMLVADRMLVSIGAVPDVALAQSAGLEIYNGIVVDETGQTSDPAIFAAGDVTNFPCSFAGCATRRESWANAQNQAIAAGKAALGQAVHYAELPWLWSDQYGHNIQIAGLPEKAGEVLFAPGPEGATGVWLSLDHDRRPCGAIGVGAPRIFRPVMKALKNGGEIDLGGWEAVNNAEVQ